MPAATATKPKTRTDLALVEIDDEALVYDPRSTYVHYLNSSAKLVYQLCDGKGTVGETACGIAEAFGTPLEQVEQDVKGLVKEFRKLGLLERRRRAGGEDDEPYEEWETDKRGRIRLDVQPST